MKNTLSLENYGVAQMTTREMRTTNGGVWELVLGFMVGLFIADLIFGEQ
jgi:hypothetical protein